MRARLLFGLAIAAIAAAGPATAAPRPVERGIVQSVTEQELVLRALDGSEVTVPVDSGTKVRVNRRRATLADIRPGFVAAAVLPRSGDRRAVVVRAFGRIATRVERGRLAAIGARVIVLRLDDGARLRIRIDRATVVHHQGHAAPRRALRRGMRVTVRLGVDGSAVRITIRGARR